MPDDTRDTIIETLALIAEGLDTRGIAARLKVTPARASALHRHALDTDPVLDRTEQARILGVAPDTITHYQSGNTTPPYPQATMKLGRSRGVLASHLLAWSASRPGRIGRPRTRPPGLPLAQWRALSEIAAGQRATPTLTVRLLDAGLVSHDPERGVVLTPEGRAVLTDYPFK